MKIGRLYIPADNNWSLMIINSNNFNEDIIKHEFIHYFQDTTKKSIQKYIKINETFNTYGIISNNYIKYIFNKKQLIPYIHNICYIFQKNGIKTKYDTLLTLNKFIKNGLFNDQYIYQYIKYCQNLQEYKWFIIGRQELAIKMLMLCNIYKKHLNTIINYIAGYFNQK